MASCQKQGIILVIKWFKNWIYQKISITKNVNLNWYSSIRKKVSKIGMIFDIENWLWKSNFSFYWQLNTTFKIQSFSLGDYTRAESWMLCKRPSKESPSFPTTLRQFLVIFSTTTLISFTKMRFWRSFWGAEQVWTSIGSKVMTQNANEVTNMQSLL